MATLVPIFPTLQVRVASDPKIEGYGNPVGRSISFQVTVASDPKIEGYGNEAGPSAMLVAHLLQVTRK